MKYMNIYFNGEALSNNVTGVERYVIQILKELDAIICADRNKYFLLLVNGLPYNNIPQLKNIEFVFLNSRKNNKIKISRKEVKKFIHEKDGIYINLAGGTARTKKSIICIHDIRALLYKEYDPFRVRVIAYISYLIDKFYGAKIVTVSDCSRREIAKKLKISYDEIEVIGNAWQHMNEIEADKGFWDRNDKLKKGEYYFALGSRYKHKNYKWIEEVAKRNPYQIFAVAGGKFRNDYKEEMLSNVVYLGYVSEEEKKELICHCKAFLNPSKFEGFGITPLEALACGAVVFSSNVSCMPEILCNSVHYFDPDDYSVNLEQMFKEKISLPEEVLSRYSWRESAKKWYGLINEMVDKFS